MCVCRGLRINKNVFFVPIFFLLKGDIKMSLASHISVGPRAFLSFHLFVRGSSRFA